MLDFSGRWIRVALPADLATGVQVGVGASGPGRGKVRVAVVMLPADLPGGAAGAPKRSLHGHVGLVSPRKPQ